MTPEQSVNTQQSTPDDRALFLSTLACPLAPAEKRCPLCCEPDESLLLSEFGICRARPDGKNLYCKSCIRKKVAETRRELKEYRAARKARQLNLLASDQESTGGRPVSSHVTHSRALSPVERVRLAISRGYHTQKEMARETRLGKDEIGDAIAELLLWTREITTATIDDKRHYFINEQQSAISNHQSSLPSRKPDVRAGFASLTELMPGCTGERKVG